MKPIKFKDKYGKTYDLIFYKDRYVYNNRIYIGCMVQEEGYLGYEPYCDITVNLPSREIPTEGCYGFLDTNSADPFLIDLLSKNEWVKDIGLNEVSGYCIYPLVEFTDTFFEMMDE